MMRVIVPSDGSQKAVLLLRATVQFIALVCVVPPHCYSRCCKSLFITLSALAVYLVLWKNVLEEKLLSCRLVYIPVMDPAVSR